MLLQFFTNPRICMGLNPENRRVVHASKEDEEQRFKGIQKRHSIAEVEKVESE